MRRARYDNQPFRPNAIENIVPGNRASYGREMRRELEQLCTLAQGDELELPTFEEIVRFAVGSDVCRA